MLFFFVLFFFFYSFVIFVARDKGILLKCWFGTYCFTLCACSSDCLFCHSFSLLLFSIFFSKSCVIISDYLYSESALPRSSLIYLVSIYVYVQNLSHISFMIRIYRFKSEFISFDVLSFTQKLSHLNYHLCLEFILSRNLYRFIHHRCSEFTSFRVSLRFGIYHM